ncbi:26S proteasome non-ATPase regulatory subunit 9 [Plasmodium inui San Antonio 1]|uniref:26S proteasome non-ATPase regulatory subunit 9 n=1 Tax=Plasmodium inui San Antonio 1 TaxID=1237626 RepID=W7A294_9APIC|nr:26S proteasome non-ATPase regulatory subunit 9 [Plasmodium inui San Antonio 1]EUD67342.1 26S proteasome non-ATPase regulatory subunit 9 [Plasmodium inui San Antonio 1]
MNLEEFNALVKERDEIEQEIKENVEFLEAPENKSVGMKGKLIDEEGFPRNDIDIYSIRVARNKVICLKNDYLNVNKRIEEYLHKVHTSHPIIRVQRSKGKDEQGNDPNESSPESHVEDYDESAPDYEALIEEAKRSTFAMIDDMVENSPSHKAGLRINDYVIQFGDIRKKKSDENENGNGNEKDNADIFKRIAAYMSNNPTRIKVKILRERKILFYFVFPNKTANGLYIGCHLTPTRGVVV